jgi:uncharacterized protein YjbI with pentapeptide repeats
MKKLSQAELDQILQQHSLWLETGGAQGERADLSHADLSHITLIGADLTRADLTGADLTGANLSRASLWCANLTRAQISASTQLQRCRYFDHLTCSPNALL